MKSLSPDTTVAEIVRAHPARSRVFESFGINAHTQDEEEIIFPAIRRLALGVGAEKEASDLRVALTKLETEHENAGAALAKLRELTDDHTPPEWACNTFRALYDGLSKLERQTHQHVHQENNVLFPKTLAVT